MRIVILDLDGAHAASMVTILDGHTVAVATTLPAAIDADLVILAGRSAIDLCAMIRARDPVLPILVLTERGLVEDRVAGLRAGADDVVEVPFHASQMTARVDALGRRAALVPRLPEILELDGCMFDLARCIAVRDGKPIALAAREASLVRWLHRHRDRTITRAEILEHVFGVAPTVESRSVDMAIATLRKKIERVPERPAIVVSVKGRGYRWGP